ncbi:MAG: NADH-quinone oxidoreductase subunit M [Campylobacter sp.]|uniref:complex I subunit 4 family protein n=1 Tax=Campylobacter sp. TaxID=205 RepID=UPI00259CF0D8|nr:NADH-quinone oxidoreductase subunit M [Campylobacter sp.]MBE6430328.1 NADH-quinone oxidoreductase subunit M [Campylobacter sp.]
MSSILTWIIFIPFLSGLFIALFCNNFWGRIVAFGASVFVAILTVIMTLSFDPAGGMQFVDIISLVQRYGITYMVGVDGINIYLILIIALFLPLLFFVLKREEKGFWANLLFIESGFLAVCSSLDLIFFYAGWEMMLLPIFVMVGLYGKSAKRAKAMLDMMYYAIFGSMIMLGAIIYLGVLHFEQFGFYSFALDDLAKLNLSVMVERVLFFSFMIAFVIKLPLFPFHMWLSKAYTYSPSVATFMLSAIASKVAVFAILRFVLPIFSLSFIEFSSYFVALGIFSMIYFGMIALRCDDFKTLLAFASASHLGLILAGVFSLDVVGMSGALYQIIAHALTSGVMFLMVGIISAQLGTRKISQLGGIAHKAPVFATLFGIMMLSSVGLPTTIGFVAELLILVGLFKTNLIYGIIATTSIIVGAVYMFVVYRKAILQSVGSVTDKFKELSKSQILGFGFVAIIIFVMGVYPKTFLDLSENTVQNHYEKYIKSNLKEHK